MNNYSAKFANLQNIFANLQKINYDIYMTETINNQSIQTTERITSFTTVSGLTFSIEGKKFVTRKPKGFRVGFSEELACSHRDISTCDQCAGTYANIIEVYGTHYWVRDYSEWLEQVREFALLDAEYANEETN
jgi:hypothetical protein